MLQVNDTEMMGWLTAWLLPWFRVLGLMSTAPLLSNRAFPIRSRIALSAAIALVLGAFVEVPRGLSLMSGAGLMLVVREVTIGIVIGFVARLAFTAFEVAGEAIGLQMGLSFAGFFDPQAGQSNAVSRMMGTLALLTFVAINGPLILVAAIAQSFTVFPVGMESAFSLDRFNPLQLGTEIFQLALSIALPFMALLLLVNVILGVISRVAPQFNVFVVGFPITIGAGLLLFAAGIPMLEEPLTQATGRLLTLLGR